MSAIPQDDALHLQLAMIAGNEPAGGLLECRYKVTDGRRRMGQSFHPADRPREFVETIRRLGAGTDTYIGCAPRRTRNGGAAAIERVWCLWADLDTPDAAARLDGFAPAPSILVLSGSHANRHAYWQLSEPLAPAHAEIANRRLAQHLGADMASTDAARILRPAGTLNHKNDPPRPVQCVRLELDQYTAAEVVGDLADPPAPARAPRALSVVRARSDDPLLLIPADEYVPALTGRPVTTGGYVQCPFHGGGQERTPSLRVYDTTWTCYGCAPQPGAGREHLGGSIYTLAALLSGYPLPLRGVDFLRVRDVLSRHFAIERAAA